MLVCLILEFFHPEFFIPSPKVRRNTWRSQSPLLVFAAVKEMAPSPRGAIGPEVPDECFFLNKITLESRNFSQLEHVPGLTRQLYVK